MLTETLHTIEVTLLTPTGRELHKKAQLHAVNRSEAVARLLNIALVNDCEVVEYNVV